MTVEPPAPVTLDRGRTLPALIAAGVLDAELAGLVWVLVERRVPLFVAGQPGDDTSAPGRMPDPAVELAAAFAPFLAPDATRARLEAAGVEGDPARDVVVTGRVAGGDLRRIVRAAGRGFGVIAATRGGSLEEVLALLRQLPVGATDDAIGRLGTVLVMGDAGARVVAAHYLRPVVRDAAGHVRHLGPAVLATWDDGRGVYDQFGWGIYPELADRIGVRPGDLEREHAERTGWLAHAATAGHGFTPADLGNALAARPR